MGGSGAGKTTLMDVIAGRKTQGEITGDILVNGALLLPDDLEHTTRLAAVHGPIIDVQAAQMRSQGFPCMLRLNVKSTNMR